MGQVFRNPPSLPPALTCAPWTSTCPVATMLPQCQFCLVVLLPTILSMYTKLMHPWATACHAVGEPCYLLGLHDCAFLALAPLECNLLIQGHVAYAEGSLVSSHTHEHHTRNTHIMSHTYSSKATWPMLRAPWSVHTHTHT